MSRKNPFVVHFSNFLFSGAIISLKSLEEKKYFIIFVTELQSATMSGCVCK